MYNKYKEETPPFCACGCGKFVTLNVCENIWNTYIFGHQRKNEKFTKDIRIKMGEGRKIKTIEKHKPIDGKYLCLKCNEYKTPDNFGKMKSKPFRNYLDIYCKECKTKINKKDWKRNVTKDITSLEDMKDYIDTKIKIKWDLVSQSVLDEYGIVKFLEVINNGKEINKISTHKIYNS